METNKIYNIDCIEGMKQIESNSIDSIVTDPPYELGFMGKSWDASGIAYNVEMWKEAFRVLKPGGHLLSFGGTRTYHRMACAIEDAGFEIRDQIQWVYGSGFPKSLNIGKAVDKIQGNERIEVGLNPNARDGGGNVQIVQKRKDDILTKGTSEFEGWGTALKPANEPICVARKPLAEKTVAENVLKYGTGGINIDECRVGFDNDFDFNKYDNSCKSLNSKTFNNSWKNSSNKDFANGTNNLGRFPANFIHDGSDEVLELLGEPSRFFYCAKASKSERNDGLDNTEETINCDRNTDCYSADVPFNRSANPKKNIHPTVKPLKLMQYLVRLVTPKGGVCLDPFMGSGTTGMAAKSQGFNYIGFDITKEYVEIAEARIKSIEIQTKL